MISIKKIAKMLFIVSILLSTFCFASPKNDFTPSGNMELKKIYVSPDSISCQNGRLVIVDGDQSLFVKTLHQDASGLYYYVMGWYGNCPYGHAYGPDGGCYGEDCIFN